MKKVLKNSIDSWCLNGWNSPNLYFVKRAHYRSLSKWLWHRYSVESYNFKCSEVNCSCSIHVLFTIIIDDFTKLLHIGFFFQGLILCLVKIRWSKKNQIWDEIKLGADHKRRRQLPKLCTSSHCAYLIFTRN